MEALQIRQSVVRVMKGDTEISWSEGQVVCGAFGTCSLRTVEEHEEAGESKETRALKASRRVNVGDVVRVEVGGQVVYVGDVTNKVFSKYEQVGLVRLSMGVRVLREVYKKREVWDITVLEILREICKEHGVQLNEESVIDAKLKRWHFAEDTRVGAIFDVLIDMIRGEEDLVWYWDVENVLEFGVKRRVGRRIAISNEDVVSIDCEGGMEVRARYAVTPGDVVALEDGQKRGIGDMKVMSVSYELVRSGREMMRIYGLYGA